MVAVQLRRPSEVFSEEETAEIVARLSALPEALVLHYFWQLCRRLEHRLEVLLQLGQAAVPNV